MRLNAEGLLAERLLAELTLATLLNAERANFAAALPVRLARNGATGALGVATVSCGASGGTLRIWSLGGGRGAGSLCPRAASAGPSNSTEIVGLSARNPPESNGTAKMSVEFDWSLAEDV